MRNTPNAKRLINRNLGFNFDYKLNPKLFLYTGLLVKSKMGASHLNTYSINNQYVDSAFAGGTVDRMINYFSLPVYCGIVFSIIFI
jgi:hypothetical protein